MLLKTQCAHCHQDGHDLARQVLHQSQDASRPHPHPRMYVRLLLARGQGSARPTPHGPLGELQDQHCRPRSGTVLSSATSTFCSTGPGGWAERCTVWALARLPSSSGHTVPNFSSSSRLGQCDDNRSHGFQMAGWGAQRGAWVHRRGLLFTLTSLGWERTCLPASLLPRSHC